MKYEFQRLIFEYQREEKRKFLFLQSGYNRFVSVILKKKYFNFSNFFLKIQIAISNKKTHQSMGSQDGQKSIYFNIRNLFFNIRIFSKWISVI